MGRQYWEEIPTVGRIVHYISLGSPDGRFKPECRAAIITAVKRKRLSPVTLSSEQTSVIENEGVVEKFRENELEVDLCVLNPTGMYFNTKVKFSPERYPEPGTWHWPERV